MILYINFYVFLKKSNFSSKSKYVSFWFLPKIPIYDKNWPKFYILWSWISYSMSVTHSGDAYKFLRVKKKSNFGSNPKVLALSLQKNASLRQNLTETLYSRSVIHNGIIYDFYVFLKNSNFNSKSKGVSLRFYRKT
jgi:hypothetical protein